MGWAFWSGLDGGVVKYYIIGGGFERGILISARYLYALPCSKVRIIQAGK
jgi:hypothetical protein